MRPMESIPEDSEWHEPRRALNLKEWRTHLVFLSDTHKQDKEKYLLDFEAISKRYEEWQKTDRDSKVAEELCKQSESLKQRKQQLDLEYRVIQQQIKDYNAACTRQQSVRAYKPV